VPPGLAWKSPPLGMALACRLRTYSTHYGRKKNMLYTIAVILIVLWLLGLVTSYTVGGFIHILIVIAIIIVLVRLISGRSP
jgi:hypothetical protein